MLTRLGFGRTAVLRASATGLLALATAVAVAISAWAVADDLAASPTTGAVAATDFQQSARSVSMGRPDLAETESGYISATAVVGTSRAMVLTPFELNSDGPLMHANAGAFFRIDDVIPRPELDSTSLALSFGTVAPPAAALIEDPPAQRPGDRVRTTISFYYCEHDPDSINPPGDGGGFCGPMRDGTIVYPGAAACAYAYLGQQFRILGDPLERIYRCADTGSAVDGQHRDIWFQTSDEGWDWLWTTGAVATIEVLP